MADTLGDGVIAAMDEARTILQQAGVKGVEIPCIVVVGEQSAGKTSLMSSLIQLPLPEGLGTVTRGPLEIRIRRGSCWHVSLTYKVHNREDVKREWTDQKLQGVGQLEIAKAVLEAQREMNEALSDPFARRQHMVVSDGDYWMLRDIIRLEVQTPKVSSAVTLIDLPGLVLLGNNVKVTEAVQKFVEDFVSRPNAIVLNVISGHTPDYSSIQHSHALLAKWADAHPEWKLKERKLTVLTKVDKLSTAEERSHVRKVISQSEKEGTYALVCTRPGGGNNNNTTLPDFEMLATEEQRLMQSSFGHFPPSALGVPALLTMLNSHLRKMAMACLPTIQRVLGSRIAQQERELKTFVDDTNKTGVIAKLRRINRAYRDECVTQLNAKHDMMKSLGAEAGAYSSNQANYIQGMLGKKNVVSTIRKLAEADLSWGMPNLLGREIAEGIYRQYQEETLKTAKSYVSALFEVVSRTLSKIVDEELHVYPKLHQQVIKLIQTELHSTNKEVDQAMRLVVEAHKFEAHTLHADALYMMYINILRQAPKFLRDSVLPAEERLKLNLQRPGRGAKSQGGDEQDGVSTLWQYEKQAIKRNYDNYDEDKKASTQAGRAYGYRDDDYLVYPVPWPVNKKGTLTSFEMLCKVMNCSPGYVVKALEANHRAFTIMSGTVFRNNIEAHDLMKALLSALARMLCSWHPMTDTVNKMVRFKLVGQIDECLAIRLDEKISYLTSDNQLVQQLLKDDEGSVRDKLLQENKACTDALARLLLGLQQQGECKQTTIRNFIDEAELMLAEDDARQAPSHAAANGHAANRYGGDVPVTVDDSDDEQLFAQVRGGNTSTARQVPAPAAVPSNQQQQPQTQVHSTTHNNTTTNTTHHHTQKPAKENKAVVCCFM